MTDINSITPSLELIEQWRCEPQYVTAEQAGRYLQMVSMAYDRFVELMERSARYGADQELEACCVWLRGNDPYEHDYHQMLRAVRRPKPPSLKEQALKILEEEPKADDMRDLIVFDTDQVNIIRRALEQLND